MPGNEPTERELEILAKLAAGETSGAIALALGISENTVRSHLRAVYAKLGLHSRAEAAVWYDRYARKRDDEPGWEE